MTYELDAEGIQTEAYALDLEQEKQQLHQKYDSDITLVKDLFHMWLTTKDSTYGNRLLRMLANEEFLDYCTMNTDTAWIYILIEAMLQEEEQEHHMGLLYLTDNLPSLVKIIQAFQFYCWRLEFLHDSEAETLLYHYTMDTPLSPTAAALIVSYTAYDKKNMFMRFSELFLAYGQTVYAFRMLQTASLLFPEDREVLELLIELCNAHDITFSQEAARQ